MPGDASDVWDDDASKIFKQDAYCYDTCHPRFGLMSLSDH